MPTPIAGRRYAAAIFASCSRREDTTRYHLRLSCDLLTSPSQTAGTSIAFCHGAIQQSKPAVNTDRGRYVGGRLTVIRCVDELLSNSPAAGLRRHVV